MTKKVLYITYDGLTDPLGQSQVLPYVAGLAANFEFTILSFEKPARYKAEAAKIQAICDRNNINWVPLKFTSSPPIFAKTKDLLNLQSKVIDLHKKHNFDIVHCRSYVSAGAGLFLKKKYNVKFLFDIRGYWVDERVDGGLWNLKNPIYWLIYKFYKYRERSYFKYADHIVTLTNASLPYLLREFQVKKSNISVIPCSTDFKLFQLIQKDKRSESRKLLNISDHQLIISYLGSIGTWYLLKEMLLLFKQIKYKFPEAIFLFITPEPPDEILNVANTMGLSKDNFIIKKASREEVPFFMSASDISVFFIKQCFSKISSSPTKLGEILALGLPVITNTRIGDMESIIDPNLNGYLIDNFSLEALNDATENINKLLTLKSEKIREHAFAIYNLESALSKYLTCYKLLANE